MGSGGEGAVSTLSELEASTAPGTLAGRAAAAVRQHELSRSELLIGRRISSGAFALVYIGRYRGQFVAVKVLRSDRVSPRDYETYIKEVNLINTFDHPHVLRFEGVCCEPPHVCIVTEYLSGGSLFDLLHPKTSSPGVPPRPRLALARVLRYAEGVCSGMAYLHSHGVIHRDLKSGNLLLDAQDVIKVGDFGVSRRLGSRAESMTAETGTYRWMAPEVILHNRYNQSIDVYSFGIVLWEMLSGELPYGSLTPVQAASAVVEKGLRPDIGRDVPCFLAGVIRTCWDPEPSRRPDFTVLHQEMCCMLAAEEKKPGSVHGSASPSWALPPGQSGSDAPAAAPRASSYGLEVEVPTSEMPLRSLSCVMRTDAVVELSVVSGDNGAAVAAAVAGEAPRAGRRAGGFLKRLLGSNAPCCADPQTRSV